MATFTITLNGASYPLEVTDSELLAGLTEARERRNASLPQTVRDEDSDDIANPDLIDSDEGYLQFVLAAWAGDNTPTQDEVVAITTQALRSYAGLPPGDVAEPDPEPPQVIAPTVEGLLAYAAAKRWAVETGGITLAGNVRVATDTVAQTKIAAAKTAFDNGTLTGTIQFKAVSGWVSADAAVMSAVYAAVVAHLQAGYAAEKAVADAIIAGTITSMTEIDAADWPSN